MKISFPLSALMLLVFVISVSPSLLACGVPGPALFLIALFVAWYWDNILSLFGIKVVR